MSASNNRHSAAIPPPPPPQYLRPSGQQLAFNLTNSSISSSPTTPTHSNNNNSQFGVNNTPPTPLNTSIINSGVHPLPLSTPSPSHISTPQHPRLSFASGYSSNNNMSAFPKPGPPPIPSPSAAKSGSFPIAPVAPQAPKPPVFGAPVTPRASGGTPPPLFPVPAALPTQSSSTSTTASLTTGAPGATHVENISMDEFNSLSRTPSGEPGRSSVSVLAQSLRIPMGGPRPPNSGQHRPFKLTDLPEVPVTPSAGPGESFNPLRSPYAGAIQASPSATTNNNNSANNNSSQHVYTEADLDNAVDTMEAFRFQFDLSLQQWKLEKDLESFQNTLDRGASYFPGGQFQWLLTQNFSSQAQATARGFFQAYEKEKTSFMNFLKERSDVLNSLLKMMTSSPLDKLDKQALRDLLDEASAFAQGANSSVNVDLVKQAEVVLTNIELQDGLLQQVVDATKAKDAQKLENLIARANAAGIVAAGYPEIAEATRVYNKILLKEQKNKGPAGKDILTERTSFNNLQTVSTHTSMIVSLSSCLPLRMDWKTSAAKHVPYPYGSKQPLTDEHLAGIDTTVAGVKDLPFLTTYLDKYVRLPVIIYDCLQYIRYAYGWSEEGLFRLAGHNDNIANCLTKYRQQHEQCQKQELYSDHEFGFLRPIYTAPFTERQPSLLIKLFSSPHDATNVMKRWLRALDEPIIPFSSYKQWLDLATVPHLSTAFNAPIITDIAIMKAHYEESQRLKQLHKYIHDLPSDNLGILTYLALYMYIVSLNHAVSKMTPENLSIVLAPNLLRSESESAPAGPTSPVPGGGGGAPMDARALLSLTRGGNDMMQNSKAINEIITLVVKYAPLLLIHPDKLPSLLEQQGA